MTDNNTKTEKKESSTKRFEGVAGFKVAPPESGKKKRKKRAGEPPLPLSINSLMDIVTIVLIYLLKSVASSAIEVNDPAIELPVSTSQETVEEATVVMLTGPITKKMNPDTGQVVPAENIPTLVVDNKPLFPLKLAKGDNGNTFRVPDNQKAGGKGFVISPLKTELVAAKEKLEANADLTDAEFEGKVVIVADKLTPYRVLMDILVTCGQAGYGQFKFAIIKDAGG